MNALSRVLEEMGLDYEVKSDREADIFAEITITKLVLALQEERCELISVTEREESLESYYINLVGGGRK